MFTHRNFSRKSGLFIFIFCILSVQLVAEDLLPTILEQSGCTVSERESIEHIFVSAEVQSIPSEMLYPKLREGIAKHVQCARLIAVLEQEIKYLIKARDILALADPELVLFAEQAIWMRTSIMLAKGYSPSTVKTIASASSHRWKDYREATVLFVNLVQWGLAEASSLIIIELVLSSRIPGSDFIGIVSIFIKGRKLYIAPDELVRRIQEVISDVATIRALEQRVIY